MTDYNYCNTYTFISEKLGLGINLVAAKLPHSEPRGWYMEFYTEAEGRRMVISTKTIKGRLDDIKVEFGRLADDIRLYQGEGIAK